jgi:hypothetical protein
MQTPPHWTEECLPFGGKYTAKPRGLNEPLRQHERALILKLEQAVNPRLDDRGNCRRWA